VRASIQNPKVPANVARSVWERWPSIAHEWLLNVEGELADLCEAFDAKPTAVLPARYGFVVAADSPQGALVMKATPDPNGEVQARTAVTLADIGTGPAVHGIVAKPTGTWIVMDAVVPGTPLAGADISNLNLSALIAPLRTMIGQSAPQIPGMSSIADWLHARLTNADLTDMPPGQEAATLAARQRAVELLRELNSVGGGDGLCHGDTSPRNILADGAHRWLLVDPRGVRGEVEYDVAVLALNTAREAPATAAILAREIGVDPIRVQAWATVAKVARV
jgi:streptomycin 6-kinase